MSNVKLMTKKRFPSYKNYVKNQVEQKRSEEKDQRYLQMFVQNFIAHDTKYAFTGKQVKELLELAN